MSFSTSKNFLNLSSTDRTSGTNNDFTIQFNNAGLTTESNGYFGSTSFINPIFFNLPNNWQNIQLDYNDTFYISGPVGQAQLTQGSCDPPDITPGAAGAPSEAPLPPRARGPAYWPPCLAQHPSRCWGKRHPRPGMHISPCIKGHKMDLGPTPGAVVTHQGVLPSSRLFKQ